MISPKVKAEGETKPKRKYSKNGCRECKRRKMKVGTTETVGTPPRKAVKKWRNRWKRLGIGSSSLTRPIFVFLRVGVPFLGL